MPRLPTAERVWFVRVARRLAARDANGVPQALGDAVCVRLSHKLLEVEANFREDLVLEGEAGHRTWSKNPHRGDDAWRTRESRRIWDEIGEHVGVGPRPT